MFVGQKRAEKSWRKLAKVSGESRRKLAKHATKHGSHAIFQGVLLRCCGMFIRFVCALPYRFVFHRGTCEHFANIGNSRWTCYHTSGGPKFHRHTPACVFFGLTGVSFGAVSQNFTEIHTRTRLRFSPREADTSKTKESQCLAGQINIFLISCLLDVVGPGPNHGSPIHPGAAYQTIVAVCFSCQAFRESGPCFWIAPTVSV